MGAYLSVPNTEKSSSNAANELLAVGASSMQGWRITQEDAHNCILDFDANTSLFSVYDGHGGAEVAIYCAERLPAFLKELPSYKAGDFEQALKDAFLGFDRTLLEEKVIEELRRLAEKNPNQDSEGAEDDEEEDLMELCQEGSLPLDQVLEKYKGCAAAKFPQLNKLKQDEAGASGSGVSKPLSPFLRGRRNLAETKSKVEAALKLAMDAGCGPSSSTAPITVRGNSMPDLEIGESLVSSSCSKSDISVANSSAVTTQPEIVPSRKLVETCEAVSMSDTNGVASPSGVADISSSDAAMSSECEVAVVKTKVQNGDITSSSSGAAAEAKQWPGEGNGEVSSNTRSAKAQDKVTVGSASSRLRAGLAVSGISSSSSSEAVEGSAAAVKPLVPGEMDDSSSDDDVDFHAEEDNSTTEDGEEDCEPFDDDLDEEDEDEETEDDEEGLVDDDDTAFCRNMIEEPGKDSGCTAVVALINGRDLYVANAGDSRCVVCRNGKAVEMSLDHKPEDFEETDRIQKAGGKVTLDGRVNGGLNLSRAIGDHAYKMNHELSPEKQMISALPDVRKLVISPEDEFMVLACDGIWNFMSSDEVVDFVKKRLVQGYDKLSQICDELFDHCLAPNTMGDGTGCDNMTAVLVCFKPALRKQFTKISSESEAAAVAASSARKRAAAVLAISEEAASSPDDKSSSSEALEDSAPPIAKKRAASPTRSDEAIITSGRAEPSESATSSDNASKRLKTDNEVATSESSADSNDAEAAVPRDEDVPMSTEATEPASSSDVAPAAANNPNEENTPATTTSTT